MTERDKKHTTSGATALLDPPLPEHESLPGTDPAGVHAGRPASFADSLRTVLDQEGRTTSRENNGTVTKWGIDSRHHAGTDVANLTPHQIEKIYREKYWNPAHCDQMQQGLATAVFDSTVNMGKGRTDLILLQAAGMIDPHENLARRITKQQMAFARNALPELLERIKSMSQEELRALITKFQEIRRDIYEQFAERAENKKYKKGWINRTYRIEALALGQLDQSPQTGAEPQLAATPTPAPKLNFRSTPKEDVQALAASLTAAAPVALHAASTHDVPNFFNSALSLIGFRTENPYTTFPSPDFKRLKDSDSANETALLKSGEVKKIAAAEAAQRTAPKIAALEKPFRRRRSLVPSAGDDPLNRDEN